MGLKGYMKQTKSVLYLILEEVAAEQRSLLLFWFCKMVNVTARLYIDVIDLGGKEFGVRGEAGGE